MRKRFFLFVILFASMSLMPLCAQNDAFFSDYSKGDMSRDGSTAHGFTGTALISPMYQETIENPAPLGSGLFLLVAGGLGYAVLRRNNSKKGE